MHHMWIGIFICFNTWLKFCICHSLHTKSTDADFCGSGLYSNTIQRLHSLVITRSAKKLSRHAITAVPRGGGSFWSSRPGFLNFITCVCW